MTNHYDIIIGTGSGGSTIAYKLAPTGKRILILEPGGFTPKEKENWDPNEVVTLGRYRPKEDWYDKDDKPFKPYIHYNVGGNSKMYGPALFRFRETDFEEVEHYGGKSPAWPFGYETLEDYYTTAEELYSVPLPIVWVLRSERSCRPIFIGIILTGKTCNQVFSHFSEPKTTFIFTA